MPLILYPIFLIVAVIVFYILGKHSAPVKEVIKTVEVAQEQEVNIYHDETEESYSLRCQNFIVTFFRGINAQYLIAPDNSYFQLDVFGNNDYNNQIRIEPYFAGGAKYIAFETRLTAGTIPNDRLPAISELINRVNSDLLFTGLSLDYENRAITYKITYKVGDHSLIEDYFWFHLNATNAAVSFIPFIDRVIINREEAVIVALDYLSR